MNGRIFKRGAVWWISFYGPHPTDKTKRKEYRESTGIKVETKNPPKAAVSFLHEHTGQVWQGTFIEKAEKVTFEDLVEAHKQDYKLNGFVSLGSLTSIQKHLRPFWSRFLPINYSETLGKKYREMRLDEGAAVASINAEMAALNHSMKLLQTTKRLPLTPPLELFPKSMETVREGFLEPGDFYAVLAHLENDWQKEFCEFAYLTGWRSGRIKTLEWSNVFLNADPPYIHHMIASNRSTKKAPSDLPLTGRLLELVQIRSEKRDVSSNLVFRTDVGRVHHNIRRAWYRACVSAGYMKADHAKGSRLLIHDFRRSAARNLDKAGVSQKTIMARAGWTGTSMFMRYRIGNNEDQIEANSVYENYIKAHSHAKIVTLKKREAK
jgi:integrase